VFYPTGVFIHDSKALDSKERILDVNSTFKSFPEKEIERIAFLSVLSAISAFLEHYSRFYVDPIVPRTLFGTETSNKRRSLMHVTHICGRISIGVKSPYIRFKQSILLATQSSDSTHHDNSTQRSCSKDLLIIITRSRIHHPCLTHIGILPFTKVLFCLSTEDYACNMSTCVSADRV
jgi:hypothetical protein